MTCCVYEMKTAPGDVCLSCWWNLVSCGTTSPILVDVEDLGVPDLLAGNAAWRKVHPFASFPERTLRQIPFGGGYKFVEWVGGKTPILVYSPTGAPKGRLTLSDLVGEWMQGRHWEDGYQALGSLDIDKDGIIRGVELSSLYLWFDRNQDAVCDPNEIEPAADRLAELAYYVTPDVAGDVAIQQGAKLLSGKWVNTWDWWMNVWNYPIFGRPNRDGFSHYSLLFPHLEQVYDHSDPVMVYNWHITSGAPPKEGHFRFIGDSSGALMILLEDSGSCRADVFATLVAAVRRNNIALTWKAGPETTEAWLLPGGRIEGHTTSFNHNYRWVADPADATDHPIAGISDSKLNALWPDILAPDKLDPNETGHFYLRGSLSNKIPTVPLQ